MPLAVAHEIGQTHDARGRKLLEDFANLNQWEIQQGPEDQPAPVDAILTKNKKIVGVIEGRTRVTHDLQSIQRMGNTYLVTHQKLLDLMECGRLLGVPSFLVIQLACGTQWGWKIGNRQGQPMFLWDCQRTQTRATSLDNTQTVRLNAYLPMEKGRMWI